MLETSEEYRAEEIGDTLLGRGLKPVIAAKSNGDRTKRKIEFDKPADRNRNIVKRVFGWLDESRHIFARVEKTAINYGGIIKTAFT